MPGSVDGIRRALEWAGLNYDFGWFAKFGHVRREIEFHI